MTGHERGGSGLDPLRVCLERRNTKQRNGKNTGIGKEYMCITKERKTQEF
jgi:hypothetical protein